MKCEDCQFWEKPDPKWKEEWGTCSRADGADGAPTVVGTKFYASDCSGYAAGLNTKPDFGCVEFKAKE
jgi:hypothetical protein